MLIAILTACRQETQVDLIIHNALIFTLDENRPQAQAMAIHQGKIVAIGAENEILNRYSASEKIDLKKSFVYPGFIDAHCHFMGYGLHLQTLDLKETSHFHEVLEKVKAFAQNHPHEWITGRGWDHTKWPENSFPDNSTLNELFPKRPVYLKRVDGHAAIANQAALNLAGITLDTKVSGGVIEKKDGRLTGILTDNAMLLLEEAIPVFTEQEKRQAFVQAQENCFAAGITAVADAGLDYADVMLIRKMQQEGELKMKMYVMLNPTKENEQLAAKGIIDEPLLKVRSFKLYADGSLGSRGALLKSDYHDTPGHIGSLVDSLQKLDYYAAFCHTHGFQLNTHAIGDSANAIMLQLYGKYLKGTNDLRWRIEHAQVVDKKDLRYFSDFTIIPSVQPTHATSDMYWAEERLGKHRENRGYAYKELMQTNGMLALGTDFPVEDISPLKTFFAAVFRKDTKGFPDAGYLSENALTAEQTLKGICIWAAIACFWEKEKGSLETGKDADFVVLNHNLLSITEEQYNKLKVLKTFVNGNEVYSDKK